MLYGKIHHYCYDSGEGQVIQQRMKTITAPTLVIFGSHDPFGLEHGIDTADTIPGAELLIIQGMGHSVPPEVWPDIIEAITRHAV